MIFTDNEVALGMAVGSLISCKSEKVFGQKLVECICGLEGAIHEFNWH